MAQALEGLLGLIQTDHASAFDVQGVHVLVFAALLSFTDVLESTVDIAVAETAPGQMLVDPHVFVVQG